MTRSGRYSHKRLIRTLQLETPCNLVTLYNAKCQKFVECVKYTDDLGQSVLFMEVS